MKMAGKKQSGNILFIILVAIAMLGIITAVLSGSGNISKDTINRQTMDAQVSQLLGHVSAIGSAILQLTMQGEEPKSIYLNLSGLKPGDAGFDDAPHRMKVFHPLGGGISYMEASSDDPSKAIAFGYNINNASIVTGVGSSDAIYGDILFTARIVSAEYCAFINHKINGSEDIPIMASGTFTSLFINKETVVIDGSNCADCVNKSRICVSNSDSSAWGFYSSLYPG